MSQTNVIPEQAGGTVPRRNERSIGALLIDAGKLTPQDAERILRLQREDEQIDQERILGQFEPLRTPAFPNLINHGDQLSVGIHG